MSQTPPADDLASVMAAVETLEELLGAARRLPFSSNVVVNEEEILEMVDRIRLSLPDDLATARHTLEERDQLLERATRESAQLSARAEAEAERMVREAQAHAAALVSEHSIVAEATSRAAAVVAAAEREAASERRAADDYAREVMQRLEDQLERWLGTVREGLQGLPEGASPGRRRKR